MFGYEYSRSTYSHFAHQIHLKRSADQNKAELAQSDQMHSDLLMAACMLNLLKTVSIKEHRMYFYYVGESSW